MPGTQEGGRGGTSQCVIVFVGKIQGGGLRRRSVPIIELTSPLPELTNESLVKVNSVSWVLCVVWMGGWVDVFVSVSLCVCVRARVCLCVCVRVSCVVGVLEHPARSGSSLSGTQCPASHPEPDSSPSLWSGRPPSPSQGTWSQGRHTHPPTRVRG